jgi:prepilin-type processing-associated H-X9-DG protein
MYENDYKGSTLPTFIFRDGIDSNNTVPGWYKDSDPWYITLVALNYLPKTEYFSGGNPPVNYDYNSVLVCPSTPDAETNPTSASYGAASGSTVYSDGFALGHFLNEIDYVFDPGETTWAATTSYAINGDNANMNGTGGDVPANQIQTVLNADPCQACGTAFLPPRKMNQLAHPSELVFICDGVGFDLSTNPNFRIINRHGKQSRGSVTAAVQTGSTNLLFFDGHVETQPRKSLLWLNNGSVGMDFYNNTPAGLAAFQQDALQGGYTSPFWRYDQ